MKFNFILILILVSAFAFAQQEKVDSIVSDKSGRVYQFFKKTGEVCASNLYCYQYPVSASSDTLIDDLLRDFSKVVSISPSQLWVTLGIQPHSAGKYDKGVEKGIYKLLRKQLIRHGVRARKIWHSVLAYTDLNGHIESCSDYEIFTSVRNKY